MVKNRSFYKVFFTLMFSIALQNLLTYSINMADNVMLGRYSEVAMSAASLCNQIQFLLQMLVEGVGVGVVVLGSQYWGKKNLEPIPHIIGAALKFGVGISSILFLFVFFYPIHILQLLTNNQAVLQEAVSYIKIICFSYVIFALTNMLVASLRSIAIVKIGYIISASTLCINIILNSVLIYGRFGFPQLGIRGAAIASLISRIVELFIVILYLKYKENLLNLSFKKLFWSDTSFISDYIKVSLPILVTQGLWGISQMVQTSILGHMGSTAIAANSVAITVVQIVTVIIYGAAGAAGIITGKTVGEGNFSEIKDNTKTFQLIFVILGIITSIIIYLIRIPILQIYSITENAKELAVQFMLILSITTLGTSYQMCCDVGIIRGGGDTKFPLYNNNFFMWIIVIPSAIISAFVFDLSPTIVFFCLKVDQILKCPIIAWRVNRYRWIHKVTRI
ncbi:MATE family efflux transporter [Anaerosacchariphilus polymeriproducens]|uniref:Probable multidrug resistance protein NorM n=1 Tax=Anaerosacchariphilus polymeriproducens TaxID=1812858 RepID=A0A371B0C9_9FIRM|nr:MATE family efflux transporter [Anaerosacchariphilus polymeriproducens]RDU25277.1 MATE family efflux transporter [Anaerosacchariphilus polymeriproducens]